MMMQIEEDGARDAAERKRFHMAAVSERNEQQDLRRRVDARIQ